MTGVAKIAFDRGFEKLGTIVTKSKQFTSLEKLLLGGTIFAHEKVTDMLVSGFKADNLSKKQVAVNQEAAKSRLSNENISYAQKFFSKRK